MGATGGYPSGVRLQIRAASDRGTGSRHHCYLRGRRCTAAPQCDENSPTTRNRNLCCTWVRRYVGSLALTDSDVALLTEPVPRSVRQV